MIWTSGWSATNSNVARFVSAIGGGPDRIETSGQGEPEPSAIT